MNIDQLHPQGMDSFDFPPTSGFEAGTQAFDWGSLLQDNDLSELSSLPMNDGILGGFASGGELGILAQDAPPSDRNGVDSSQSMLESWLLSSSEYPGTT